MQIAFKQVLRVGVLGFLVALLSGCVIPVKPGMQNKSVVKIVEVKGLDKDELFARAGDWLALAFVSAPDILKNKDPVRGRYMGKAVNNTQIGSGLSVISMPVDFNIIIDTKDGRARIILDNYHAYNPEVLNKAHDDMWKLAISFTRHMQTGGKYNQDW